MNGAKGNPQTLSCLLKHPREENQEHDGAKILQNKGKSSYEYEEIRDISGVFFQAAYELSRDLPDAD